MKRDGNGRVRSIRYADSNENGSVRKFRLLIELFDFCSTQTRQFFIGDQASEKTRATVNLVRLRACVCAGVIEKKEKRKKKTRCVVKITLAVRKSGVTREQNRTETKRNAKKDKKNNCKHLLLLPVYYYN